jgi:hypothetical protein
MDKNNGSCQKKRAQKKRGLVTQKKGGWLVLKPHSATRLGTDSFGGYTSFYLKLDPCFLTQLLP